MIVVGIDPGFASLGYVVASITADNIVVIDAGTIKTKKAPSKNVLARDSNVVRFLKLYDFLDEVVPEDVDYIFCEGMSQPRDASASWKLALGWGAVLSVVANHRDAEFHQFSPMVIKKHVCGIPTASKDQVIAAIRSFFPTGLNWPKNKGDHEHMADAIGAMLTGLALVVNGEQ